MLTLSRALVLSLPLAIGLALGANEVSAAPGAGAKPVRATCPRVADATTLIPDGAKAILRVDGSKTFRSTLYRDLRTALDRDLKLKDGLAVLDACGLGLEDIDALTAAVGANDETVAIVEAKGIGGAKTLACLRERLAARRDGKQPWTTRRDGCFRVLSEDGRDFAFALDASTLVLTRGGWADEVRGLIHGKGKSAAATSSAGALASIDRTKALWFSMALSDRDRSAMSGSAAANLESMSGAMDFARGMDLVAHLRVPDPGAALQLRDELTMYRDLIDGMGTLPKGLADQVRVDANGPAVELSVALSPSDLERLRRVLEPHTQGRNPL